MSMCLTGSSWECPGVIKEMLDFSPIQKVNISAVECNIRFDHIMPCLLSGRSWSQKNFRRFAQRKEWNACGNHEIFCFQAGHFIWMFYNCACACVCVCVCLCVCVCVCVVLPGLPLQSCWEMKCLMKSRASTCPSRSPSACSPPPCAVLIWSSQRTSATFAKVHYQDTHAQTHTCTRSRTHTHMHMHRLTHMHKL